MSKSGFRLRPTSAFRGLTAIAVLMLIAGTGLSRPALAASDLLGHMTPITPPSPTSYAKAGFSYAGGTGGTDVSADGQTALVLALQADVGTAFAEGKAYIYHDSNGQWTLAAELDDPDNTGGDNFGSSGALSANGTVAIIGSKGAIVNGQTYAGKAYIFTRSNGTWTLTHTFNDPPAAYSDNFGFSVGLSADGATAAISALPLSTNFEGEIYIYHKANGAWNQEAAIPDPDKTKYDLFGSALAIAGDGNSVLVGSAAPVKSNSGFGKAYLYGLSNGGWTQTHEFDDPTSGVNDYFGDSSVALSADGQSAAISDYGTTINGQLYAGTTYIYQASNGVWSRTATLPNPDPGIYTDFGIHLGMSASGKSLLIGSAAPASGTYTYAGKANLYTQSNGNWSETKTFDDPAATANDLFGFSGVALSGDGQTAVIGAGFTKVNGVVSAGEAYIYQTPADLSLTVSPLYSELQQYSTESFDATVVNNATNVTANNVVLSFNIPAGLSYIGGNAGNGTCSQSGQTATCTLASLAPGAVWQPTVLATAAKTGTATTTMTVTSAAPDPATANNTASASVTVTPYPKTAGKTGGSSSGGGASSPLGLLALTLLLGFTGLRRQVPRRKR